MDNFRDDGELSLKARLAEKIDREIDYSWKEFLERNNIKAHVFKDTLKEPFLNHYKIDEYMILKGEINKTGHRNEKYSFPIETEPLIGILMDNFTESPYYDQRTKTNMDKITLETYLKYKEKMSSKIKKLPEHLKELVENSDAYLNASSISKLMPILAEKMTELTLVMLNFSRTDGGCIILDLLHQIDKWIFQYTKYDYINNITNVEEKDDNTEISIFACDFFEHRINKSGVKKKSIDQYLVEIIHILDDFYKYQQIYWAEEFYAQEINENDIATRRENYLKQLKHPKVAKIEQRIIEKYKNFDKEFIGFEEKIRRSLDSGELSKLDLELEQVVEIMKMVYGDKSLKNESEFEEKAVKEILKSYDHIKLMKKNLKVDYTNIKSAIELLLGQAFIAYDKEIDSTVK
jgi:hypothetical protein